MPPGVTLGAVALALTATLTGPAAHAPVVPTTDGLVRGVTTGGQERFLGIPYAAPPVGSLRWQPPRSPARWQGVRDADELGSPCAQNQGFFDPPSASEDCLYLNVLTPKVARDAPVMVWLHGGSLVNGSGGAYDPTKLVRDGVVVVTVNYRLGALGFLAHPAFSNGGPTGDYGLMDQQLALRWVSRNIGHFGGNPHNVTIFGESAGGLSVLSHLASPLSRGLFDRAIVQSGAYELTQKTQSAAEAQGEAFATAAGCPDQSAACLRDLPVETVLAHQSDGYTPNLDGRTLTRSIGDALVTGQFARVPVVNGTNRDEWRLFVAADELRGRPVTAENYVPMIGSLLGVPPQAANAIAAEYPLTAYAAPPLALGAVGTDAIFACPGLTVSRAAAKYVPTYAYEFNDENAPALLPPVSFPQGAAHAAELPYLFDLGAPAGLSPSQEKLASAMRRSWTSFADHATPLWPRFTDGRQLTQSLVPPHPQPETDFAAAHHCSFWAAL
ncbi:carboxylesterase/lipase family protein [Actinophytocola oryzae]|uniref:Carboxylic ester hydrolase n=1 Tax=Actinophytocola oryzae TaxID=502181 RepID=A0A4R7V133_9PSEU|nr:carboxylesterase family protein [Actinophytocola oryzae]TDV42182.1 para-nitrobenzyl esterase [Actinophytocola oryzae]